MSKVVLDELYWTELMRFLEPLSQHTTIERFLFNTADFEELANVIFDDLDVLRHLDSLPDSLTEVRSFGDAYFERLEYLIGHGPQVTRNAPIYDPNERARLFTETTMFLEMLDQMLDENSET